ncbi:hypothetical protein QZH41_002859 [Actinostola sp. cb2023]|nr:hypothetical protein QZH41_002859 [Actinostola sp. cb2023]
MGTLVRRNLARVQANRASTASALHSFSLPRLLASRNGRLFDDIAGLLPPQEKFYRTFFDKPRAFAEYRIKHAAATDKRLTAMNEIIAGIRAVKMYAWEWNYRDIVKSLRRKEVNLVRIKSVLLSFSKALYFTLRVIASLTSITTMLYLGIHLTAVNVFTVVCILNTMTDSTNRQIFGIINVYDSIVSINRIQAFLLQNHVQSIKDKNITDEKLNSNNTFAKTLENISNAFRKDSKPNYNDTYSNSKYTVLKNMDDTFPNKTSNTKHGVDPYLELLQVSSGWVEDETSSTIHDISLKVESNMLLIVTGPVGSGKSTLLMTMLNEIDVKSGHISSSGKMAYVSQIPWIFTGTVRENILFGKPFDETRYEKVLEVCELNADIHEFPKGDLCVIGQRGVMLSGGQRVRVSLARAVYSDADIFLLDDPLSAVDAKVGQHIFDKCICGELSGKIRILVTHQLQHLHRADEIVVLEEGFITRKGSFSEMSEDETFDQIFANYSSIETSDSKQGRTVHIIEHEKDKGRRRRDLVQEDEDKAIGTVSWRLYWGYFRFGLPSVLIVCLFLFFAAAQASPIIPTWWLKVVITMTHQMQKSATVLGIYGGMVGGSFIMVAISTILMFAALLRSSEKMHDKMTLAVLKSPVLFFDTNPVGRIMNRFSKDIGAMDDLLPNSLITMTTNFFYFFAVLVLTGIVNYWLIIAVIPTLAVFFLLCRYYLKPARDLSRLEAILRSPVYAHVSETLEGLEVIHSLHMEEKSIEKLYNLQNWHTRAFSLVMSTARWVGLYSDGISALFVTAVAVATVYLPIDSATAGFLLAYVISIVRQTSVAMRFASDVETQMISVERVKRYTMLSAESGYERQGKPPEDWPDQGALSLQGVSMVYLEGGACVLKDITFDVKPQEKVGIAGRTGAGKSSLVAALFRMPDPQGRILIDGIDLGTLNVQAARRSMAVISQNPVLFSGTLKHNLDFFRHFTEEQIWTALTEVQMKTRVSKLDGLLEYPIGESGSGFSVGETQLLCLARALLQRCKILVLDEATANVDYKTDQLVQQVIREKFCNCTVLTIAHRLNTIMDYDRVLGRRSNHFLWEFTRYKRPTDGPSKSWAINYTDSKVGLDFVRQLEEKKLLSFCLSLCPACDSPPESNMLLIVTGPVGSGKSTLLMTMLREIDVKSGHISSSGKMAYVSQIPWIFTGTVRENILFGKPFDQTRYEEVLEACELNPDIHDFPKGDLSVIGQRGVMLSGGQRVRVSLARAVYSDADIFLLDDPLSAVDAKVGQHIFDKCICGELSGKIRILVTHQLQHLHRADEIIVLEEGSILRRGSFGELREDENVEHMFANHGRNETSDSKEDQIVQIIKNEKEKDKNRLDLVQEDEDKAIGTVSWRLYWDYFRCGLPSVLIVGLFLFFAAAQASPIIPTWWLKVMTKMTYQKQKSPTALGIYGGLVGGSFIMVAISTILMFAALLRSSEKLHDKMTLAVLKSPVLFFDTNPVGRIMNRFSKDIGAMDDLLPISFFIMTMNFFYFFGVLVLTGIVNYWLIIAVIPTLAVLFLLCHYYLKPARDLSRLEAILRSPVYAHISETMEGLEVIHSLQMEDMNVEKLYNLQNLHTRAFSLVVSTSRWLGLYTDGVSALFVTVVAVATVYLPLDSATAGFILAYVISIMRQTSIAMRYCSEVETQMVSVERVKRYTMLSAEPGYERQDTPPEDWPDQGALSLQGVSMVYLEGGTCVLKDIKFDVKPQEKVGIAGRTGAGKSSLVAALFRMPDPQGPVLIDGIDLGTLNVQAARGSMAVISQNPVLFSGTLKRNLDPFRHFTDEQIWTALTEVQMKTRVSKLDGLLEYPIGESGSGFSVGETQLLCLARALLQRCKILVLDEATANVDYKTDQLVQQVIRRKFCNCTVLTIAHRLNTIMDYDRVLVLDRGHVVEYDSPTILAAKSDGVFAQLLRTSNMAVQTKSDN